MHTKEKHPLLRIFENKWLQHLLFWVVYLGPTAYFTLTVCDIQNGIIPLILIVSLTLTTAYFNLNFLVTRYLLKEKYLSYFLLLGVLLLVYCALYTLTFLFSLEFFFKVTEHKNYVNSYLGNIFELAMMLVITTTFTLSKDWFRQQQLNRNLLTEKLKAEIKLLRSQMNSHLMFNTLNNLYGLALTQSKKTPDAILRLSEMMEYMLYESDGNHVALEKELSFIQSYIETEKLRYKMDGDIQLNISGSLSGHRIAPLLLMPFIENAFMHGESISEPNAYIHITIEVKEGILSFMVKNSKPRVQRMEGSGGLGLKNVHKRLELLYPGKYELNISDKKTYYSTHLILFLS